MKTQKLTILLVLIFISINSFSQEKSFQSLLNVTVTDFDSVPSAGDRIYFISKKTNKSYSEISGSDGKFKTYLPNGSEYEVKIKSFDQAMNYTAIEIADADYDMEFDIAIMYELPKTYTLKDVFFDTNSAKLQTISYPSLNELAEFMLDKTSIRIELAGHTDSDGEEEMNLDLSQKRAETVRNYLIKKGVASNRLTAVGYGETQPIASNETDEGKSQNRRTEVRILEQ